MSGIKRGPGDIAFSKMIRERDEWMCRRCGKEFLPSSRGLHSAHMFTRRIQATRHDPDNAVALCYGCHQYLDSHPDEKWEFWQDLIGAERLDALEGRAHAKRDREQR